MKKVKSGFFRESIIDLCIGAVLGFIMIPFVPDYVWHILIPVALLAATVMILMLSYYIDKHIN